MGMGTGMEYFTCQKPIPVAKGCGFSPPDTFNLNTTLFLSCHVCVTTLPPLSARATTNATMQRRMGWKRREKRELDRKENKITIAK